MCHAEGDFKAGPHPASMAQTSLRRVMSHCCTTYKHGTAVRGPAARAEECGRAAFTRNGRVHTAASRGSSRCVAPAASGLRLVRSSGDDEGQES